MRAQARSGASGVKQVITSSERFVAQKALAAGSRVVRRTRDGGGAARTELRRRAVAGGADVNSTGSVGSRGIIRSERTRWVRGRRRCGGGNVSGQARASTAQELRHQR